MKSYIILLLGIVFSMLGQAQNPKKYAKTISEEDLKSHLSLLASDSLEGRETGERGQKMAADYISKKFEEMGLQPPVPSQQGASYFQHFPVQRMSYLKTYLKKGDEIKDNFKDFLYYSRAETYGDELVEIVYVKGATLENLKTLDLKGKYVCFSNEEKADWRKLASGLKSLDVPGVLVVEEDPRSFQFIMSRVAGYLSGSKVALDIDRNVNKILFIDPEMASWIFDMDYESLKSSSKNPTSRLIFNSDYLVEEVVTENILGFIPGSEKPEEILVITAHYDHIGVSANGDINNGADDDGSGTSAVLEIAQAFAKAYADGKQPKRSVLFMTVSGEEKGLLGSEYYSKNPIFPLKNTVTDLNIDMVGRIDPQHEGKGDYVYVIGSDKISTELHQLSETINEKYINMEFDYTYNAPDDPNRYYYRSDHYNFAKNGVPVIFYFNGTHEDYHRPGDTVDKIDFRMLRKRTELVFYTAWELAFRSDRVKID